MSEALKDGQIRPGTLEYWADRKPSEIAYIEGKVSLTWAEANARADQLAGHLARLGLSRDSVVSVRTQSRIEWPIIAAALGKLGCRLIATNWRLTPAELGYILRDGKASAIICDDSDPAALTPTLDTAGIDIRISIDHDAPDFIAFGELLTGSANPRFSEGNPQLIIYTSGTTGFPKGVLSVLQRSSGEADACRAEYLSDVAASRRRKPDDVVLIALPLHHFAGIAHIWGAGAAGNKTVISRRFDPEETLALIERHRITNWAVVPTILKRLAALPPDVLARYDVSSIRAMGVSSAPVPHAIKLWAIDYFGVCVSESYGATEVGMATYLPPEEQLAKPGSSGRLHRHARIDVRDKDGSLLPPGVPGDLWVWTPAAIEAYANGTPVPAEERDANGFIRVGDVGYFDNDGYLYISDRSKDMIISGGVNIYPAEIENAILTLGRVQDAAVFGIPDDEFGEQVRAVCELKPGAQMTTEQMIQGLRPLIASYKLPKTIEFVETLPRNTVGKVLKRELRAPFWAGRERNV